MLGPELQKVRGSREAPLWTVSTWVLVGVSGVPPGSIALGTTISKLALLHLKVGILQSHLVGGMLCWSREIVYLRCLLSHQQSRPCVSLTPVGPSLESSVTKAVGIVMGHRYV